MANLGIQVAETVWSALAQHSALETVTFTSLPAPTRDLEGGQVTGAGTSVQVAMLIRGYRSNEIDGVAITARDLLARFPVAAIPMVPTTRDVVTWNGEKWSVVAVKKAANGGLSVLAAPQAWDTLARKCHA